MKSTRHLGQLRAFNQVVKRASPGERVMSSLTPYRSGGYPGLWASDRINQVQHFLEWVYVAIDLKACKIASILPNVAESVGYHMPGVTVKAGQRSLLNLMGWGFGGEPYVGGTTEKTWSRPVNKNGDYRLESTWDQTKSTAVSGMYVGTAGYKPEEVSPVGFSGGGHSFLTMGEWRSKALSVVKPHENLKAAPPNHPLLRLMLNPNPVDTYYDIEYEKYMFRRLTGVSYEWTPKNAYGEPCERWCIPSHWVYPRTGGGGTFHHYVPFNQEHADELIWDYEIRPYGWPGYAGVLHFPPDEVIVQRNKHPMSKIDGYSSLFAGAKWIDESEGISTSRWSQMINQARSELLIKLGPGYEDMDADMIARAEAKFMNRVQGPFNYGKPLWVPPGADVTTISFSPSEMAYFESMNQSRDMILALERVPKAAIGNQESMTYGSIMAVLGWLCVSAINPELTSSGLTYTKFLAPQFNESAPAWSTMTNGGYGGAASRVEMRIWYDDVVPADPQQVNADIAEDRAQYAITPNEVRALRGRQPYRRGGDNPIMQGPGGAIPLAINVEENVDEMAAIMQQLANAQEPTKKTERAEVDPNQVQEPVDQNGDAAPQDEQRGGATGLKPPETTTNGAMPKKSTEKTQPLPSYINIKFGTRTQDYVTIEAIDTRNGKKVGEVDFNLRRGNYWTAGAVGVSEAYQRQGIASGLYDFAEKHGMKLKPSETQTPAGEALWTSRPKALGRIGRRNIKTLCRYIAKQVSGLADQKTVAVDFDGTINNCSNSDCDDIQLDQPREGVKEALQALRDAGLRIVIWTASKHPEDIGPWLEKHGIPYDFINENPGHDSMRKIEADAYVDDKGINSRDEWPDLVKQILGIAVGDPKQPVDTWDKLRDMEPRATEELRQVLANMTLRTVNLADLPLGGLEAELAKPGGVVIVAPTKGEKRASEKVDADYDGDWSKLVDVFRAAVALDTEEDLQTAVANLRTLVQFARQPKDYFREPMGNGYRAYHVLIRLPCGAIAEVQFHLKPLLVARERVHVIHETIRTMEAALDEEGRDTLTPAESEAIRRAKRQARQLFAQAWDEVTAARNQWEEDNQRATPAINKPEQKGKPTTITDAIHQVVSQFGMSACDINEGACEAFAEKVNRLIGGKAAIRDVSAPKGGGHAFLEYQGRYYDAESPNGVTSLQMLPFFRRYKIGSDGKWTDVDGSEKNRDDLKRHMKGLVFDTVATAGKWLANRWADLESRYGRKTALAMAVGMVATSPLPGNIPAIIAAAEAVRGISGYFQRELKGIVPKHGNAPSPVSSVR